MLYHFMRCKFSVILSCQLCMYIYIEFKFKVLQMQFMQCFCYSLNEVKIVIVTR